MKFTAVILALIATSQAASIEQKSAQSYTYEDIREQELKCKADRNREWKYDAATNTWACPLQRYDWACESYNSNERNYCELYKLFDIKWLIKEPQALSYHGYEWEFIVTI